MKTNYVALTVLGLVALIIVGGFWYLNQGVDADVQANAVAPQGSSSSTTPPSQENQKQMAVPAQDPLNGSTRTHADAQHNFSIQYPSGAQTSTSPTYYNPLTGKTPGTDIFQIRYDGNSVDVFTDPAGNCTTSLQTQRLNGVPFYVNSSTDYGAGQKITVTTYESVHAGTCYRIVQQVVTSADEIPSALNDVVQSFNFLVH